MSECGCEHPDYAWYLETNESGWRCLSCQEEIGYSAKLDKEYLGIKVECIQLALQEFGFVYFSNSTEGHFARCKVLQSCESQKLYDQYTIVLEFMKLEQPRHAKYWQKRRENPEKKQAPRIDWSELEA